MVHHRRHQAPGSAAAGRAFLPSLPIERLVVHDARQFHATLDEPTLGMRAAMPTGGNKWGLSRKLLNLLLRDAHYTGHLEERYGVLIRPHEVFILRHSAIVWWS